MTSTGQPCRDCFGTGRNQRGGPCKTCRGTGQVRGAIAGLQAIGSLLRLLVALGIAVIIIVIVIAAIAGGSSNPSKRQSRADGGGAGGLSLDSTCAAWKRATPARRLAWARAQGNGTVGSATGLAETFVLGIGQYCLRSEVHGRPLTQVSIGDAPVLTNPSP